MLELIFNGTKMPSSAETLPLYQVLATRLTAAIKAGKLESGLILLEGPLSDVFGTSRATVRNALALLAEDGTVDRFTGRGFIVGGPTQSREPIRRRVSSDDFPKEDIGVSEVIPASDRIIPEVEEAIRTAIAFGHYRINEQRLASRHGVSRPIIREVLWRLRELGLVEKDMYSSWLAGPLTARAISEDSEMRRLLEPPALLISAPQLSQDEISAMMARVETAIRTVGLIDPAIIDRIEIDLHENCLRHFTNTRIHEVLRKGRTMLMVTGLFARFIGIEADSPGIAEHRAIIEAIAARDWDAASRLHADHLHRKGTRTLQRLKVLSVIQEPPLPDYLERVI